MSKVWFVTGASRGLGVEFTNAALSAGDRVVATGRKVAAVHAALGPDTARLLCLDLDVTDAAQIQSAVDKAVSKFGTIDVLVNNAGYGHIGFFEESSADAVREQFDTNVFGVFSVTRAVLPVMRKARKGHLFNLSSGAGIRGNEFASIYCSTKFAIEGWSEGLAAEIAPFGISVTIIEPGPFRTDFLTRESLRVGNVPIADYDDRRARNLAGFENRHGTQPGDPARLAEAVVRLSREAKPPMRFIGGKIALDLMDRKLASVRAEVDTWRAASAATDYPQ